MACPDKPKQNPTSNVSGGEVHQAPNLSRQENTSLVKLDKQDESEACVNGQSVQARWPQGWLKNGNRDVRRCPFAPLRPPGTLLREERKKQMEWASMWLNEGKGPNIRAYSSGPLRPPLGPPPMPAEPLDPNNQRKQQAKWQKVKGEVPICPPLGILRPASESNAQKREQLRGDYKPPDSPGNNARGAMCLQNGRSNQMARVSPCSLKHPLQPPSNNMQGNGKGFQPRGPPMPNQEQVQYPAITQGGPWPPMDNWMQPILFAACMPQCYMPNGQGSFNQYSNPPYNMPFPFPFMNSPTFVPFLPPYIFPSPPLNPLPFHGPPYPNRRNN
ncbi:uncharacterized protein LOC127543261 [Antechinus flavipes]|uniref:uncharacterized protein LOC127543261 n=1 Tax=Antechinus flavipes TaxID=38775 RepID=UPI002235E2D9|nr:uncharacterized protein LOC127543261 [Antechinus flavipes]